MRQIKIITSALLVFGPMAAHAVPMVEGPDAGPLPGSAQDAVGATWISGTLDSDADLFRIFITDPGAFSATTDTSGTDIDTQLFLFDDSGLGVFANDDKGTCTLASTSYCSLLPSGNANGPVATGHYYLGISSWNNDPMSAGGVIFPSFPYDGVFGPTGPGGGQVLSGWSGGGGAGAYHISLTGVGNPPVVQPPAVPEPGTLALLGIGLAGIGFSRRRKANDSQ